MVSETRKQWLDWMLKICAPVLTAQAQGKLRETMPVYHHPESDDRPEYTYLEALGRSLCGMAPWLELGCKSNGEVDEAEAQLIADYGKMARAAIKSGVTPGSPDELNFERGYQPIVDAAFLAEALLRAPNALWAELDAETQHNLIAKLKATRTRKPYPNNWLLFAGIIEAFLYTVGEPDWDQMRIDYALRQHMAWYKGDGIYGDGPQFHLDFYNSFVIQPMLRDILITVAGVNTDWDAMRPDVDARAMRFAAELERLISPEGTYPIVGRSSCYRFGVFHSLSQSALTHALPDGVTPAQVRCGLTAVMRSIMAHDAMFDENGWLKIGVCGYQPGMGERYISTGSLYLCSTAFLPLGLDDADPFWTDKDADWTQRRLWNGEDMMADHALMQ